VIATERVRRPADFAVARPPRAADSCVLCAGREAETPPPRLVVPDGTAREPWRVRVVPSKFPVLRAGGALERRGEGLYDLMAGVGAHEVVVAAPAHETKLGDLPVATLDELLEACRSRVLALRDDARLRSAAVFMRHDPDAAGRARHPHWQVLATPVVPREITDEIEHARAYHDYRERCVFCDMLRQEIDDGGRVVAANEHAVALAPFAARVPFEVWMLPRRHAAAFESVGERERRDVAAVLRTVVRKLDRAVGDPAFDLALHGAPFGDAESPSYHWHVELLPRLPGGTATVAGFFVNPLPPEDAARFLRDVPD